MYKISDIVSMPIISIYESEYFGIVYNIMIDCKYKKIKYLCLLNEKDNVPKIVSVKDLYKIGSDCIFIKNKNAVSLKSNFDQEINGLSNPINLLAYNFEGKYLGIVNDAVFDDKFKINEFSINNKPYSTNEIFNLGQSSVIVNNKKINLKKFKPIVKLPEVQTVEKVIVQNPQPTNNKNQPETQITTKIITDYRFLIGRIINKDIMALNGEIIAKTGTKITTEIINKASYFGRLVEIARYSNK